MVPQQEADRALLLEPDLSSTAVDGDALTVFEEAGGALDVDYRGHAVLPGDDRAVA